MFGLLGSFAIRQMNARGWLDTWTESHSKLHHSNLSDNSYMAADTNIKLPDDLLAQMQKIAQVEGKTPDEVTAEAVKRDIALRLIAKLRREAKPSGMTEEQEMEASIQAVHDYRRGR